MKYPPLMMRSRYWVRGCTNCTTPPNKQDHAKLLAAAVPATTTTAHTPQQCEAALEKIASAAYTKASVELLALTAKTSKRLRPKAKVGFYGLPVRAPKPQPTWPTLSPAAAASPACALARDVLLRTAHEGLAPPGRSTSSTGRSRS